MLAAGQRGLTEAAGQGIVEPAGACAAVEGVSVVAVRQRLKAPARVRLTPAPRRQLCDAPNPATLLGLRDRAWLATLAGSGCRSSAGIALTVGQRETRDGGSVLEVLGKGQAPPRDAPLRREAYAHLQAWLTARAAPGGVETPVILTACAGPRPTARQLTAGAAWCAVRTYALQCGLAHVTPHDLRRFVGTQLATRALRQAQKALGH